MTGTPIPSDRLDANYQAQRARLRATILAAISAQWAATHTDRNATIAQTVKLVTAGQAATVKLVDAYMTMKTMQAGHPGVVKALDPAEFTIAKLRGVSAESVYERPFGAYGAFRNDGADAARAVQAAQASVTKLAATDIQLAQTHAAKAYMDGDHFIVGYRRVLNPPSCELCVAAAERTYRVAELSPIHEHCDCGVAPLFGTAPVASIGTAVRVEHDPEIGPRLMAADWSSVGPRLIEKPAF